MTEFGEHAIATLKGIDASQIPADATFVLEQRITSEDGTVETYHVVVADNTVDVQLGSASSPDIVMTQDADTAAALRAGETHAQGAFLAGRLSIDGDMNRLLEVGPLLSQLLSSGNSNA